SKEKVSGITGIEMGITPKAEELASRMSKLVKEGVGPTERGMAKQEMVQEFGDRLIALHAEDQIHSVSELMVWLNANQPDATKTMTSDELGLVQLAYDTKDGVALAMVANTGDNLDAKLKGVMWGRGNSGAKVEKELGFDKGPSTVLEGLGNEVLKTAITDKDLVVVLKKLG
ncbi:hypothetical protein COS78_01655, partial [Candidatus Shapirobacteria bacterium CG06_land_8_20_14_3_00_40_12]